MVEWKKMLRILRCHATPCHSCLISSNADLFAKISYPKPTNYDPSNPNQYRHRPAFLTKFSVLFNFHHRKPVNILCTLGTEAVHLRGQLTLLTDSLSPLQLSISIRIFSCPLIKGTIGSRYEEFMISNK